MTDVGFRLGASIWGFYGRRPPGEWPSLSEAVRAILAIDPALGVEVWGSKALDAPETDEAEITELAEACRAAAFVTVHTRGIYWRWDPASLRREIDFAACVGGEMLVLHPVCLGLKDPDDRIDTPEIRRIAGYAAERGVRLAVENVRHSISTLDRVLEEVGDDPETSNVGICIDVGHAHLSRDAGREPIVDYIERYAGQLVHLHLHDGHGEEDEHLVPGGGTIDWQRTLDALDRIGFAGTGVLEVHPPDGISIPEGIWAGLEHLERSAG